MSFHLAVLRLAATKPVGDPLRAQLIRLAAGEVTWAQVTKVLDKAGLTEGNEDDEGDDWDYYQDKRYSGRGMTGRKSSVAVVLKDMQKHGPTSDVGKKLKALGLSYDSMGKGVVYYLFGSSTDKTASFSLGMQSRQWVSLFVTQMSLLETDGPFDGAWQIAGDLKVPYLDNQTVKINFYLPRGQGKLKAVFILPRDDQVTSMLNLALDDLLAAKGAQLLSTLQAIEPSDKRTKILTRVIQEAYTEARTRGPSASLVGEGPISTILLWLRQQPVRTRMDPVWQPLLDAKALDDQGKDVSPVWSNLLDSLSELSKRYRVE